MNALSLSSSPTIALPNYIIDATPGSFNDCFNRFSFTFSHTLAGHPLFELSNLAEISEITLASGQPEKCLEVSLIIQYSGEPQSFSTLSS